MIGNIILFLITFLAIWIMIYILYIAFKKSNNLIEKISEMVIAMNIAAILLIYYLDRYNIPTMLNIGTNLNTQNWLSFIGNYITGIISAAIGALVAVWTTMYQIRKNNEENNRRDKENLKIQNMPILKYDINTEKKGTGDISELIITNYENGVSNIYNLNIILKNIGMNSIRNIIIDYKSSIINNSIYRLLGKNEVNPLEKGEIIELNKYFSLKPSNKNYKMYITIYYQDVISNWYKQEIQVCYNASNTFHNGSYFGRLNYEVKKEIEITEDEIEKNII